MKQHGKFRSPTVECEHSFRSLALMVGMFRYANIYHLVSHGSSFVDPSSMLL